MTTSSTNNARLTCGARARVCRCLAVADDGLGDYFDESAFYQKVDEALVKVATILDTTKHPRHPADVPHTCVLCCACCLVCVFCVCFFALESLACVHARRRLSAWHRWRRLDGWSARARSYDDKYALAKRATLSTISALLAALEVLGLNGDSFQEMIAWSLANKSVSLRLVRACAARRGAAARVFVSSLIAEEKPVVGGEVLVHQEGRARRRDQPGDDRVRDDGHEHYDVDQGEDHAQAIRCVRRDAAPTAPPKNLLFSRASSSLALLAMRRIATVHVIEYLWKFDFSYQIEVVAGAGGEPLRLLGRSGTVTLITSSDSSPRPETRGAACLRRCARFLFV